MNHRTLTGILALLMQAALYAQDLTAVRELKQLWKYDEATALLSDMIREQGPKPALLEELVFRGFILQPLRRYGDWFAIITSALLFGLIHGNMTQAPFAILAGIALGYINIVSGSMWMNILLHFLNNLISVLYSFALASSGEGGMILLSLAVTYGVIAIGGAAFIGYVLNNRNFARLYPGEASRTPHRAAHYWLMPTMVIALALLFYTILSDMVIR